jgi:hypothetical protein
MPLHPIHREAHEVGGGEEFGGAGADGATPRLPRAHKIPQDLREIIALVPYFDAIAVIEAFDPLLAAIGVNSVAAHPALVRHLREIFGEIGERHGDKSFFFNYPLDNCSFYVL